MGHIVDTRGVVFRGVAAQFVGERQLARDRVEARHRQRTFIRGHGIARERALFEHHNAANHDGGHAVRRIDAQGATGRGGRIILPSLRTIRQAGFVHRHLIRTGRRIGRFDDDTVILAVDGDGHLAFGDITVRVCIGVGELFRQGLAVRELLHRRIVVVEPVAVGTVGVQRDFAILAALVRIPREIRAVRTGHGVCKRVAGNGIGIPFRHAVREASDGGPVIPDGQVQTDLGTGAVAVAVRHRQLHADAVERQDIIRIAVVGMIQGTVIIQGKGDIALAVDMHIEDFRITGHADDTAFIIDGQHDRHHLATDDGSKGILRAGIQREFIAAAALAVRTGSDIEVAADILDGLDTRVLEIGFIQLQCGILLHRHLRPVVHHVHGDGRTAAVTVRIRHRHRQVMGDLRIRSGIALVVFRGVPVECVGEVQPARGRIIAGHGQGSFIRGHRRTGQRAVLENLHAADDNGRHTVRGVDDQGSSGRDRSVGRAGSRAIGKAGFMDRHHFRSRIDIGRCHSHVVIHPAIATIPGARLHRVCGKLYTAVEADVQATQMVDAVQQVAAAIFIITAAARGAAAGGGTGSGHQVFAKGREEVLPADLHAVHLKRGHLLLGIGGVEPLHLDGSAILKGQDKIVAAAGQRRGISRKIENEAPVRSAGDGLCGTSSRLGKTDIGHEDPRRR